MEVQDCSPLRFDLRGKISQLVSAHPRFPFPDALVDSASRTTEVLNCVARLLAFPALTDEVSSRFRPILMDLCCRWLDLDDLDAHRIFESFAALARPHKEIFPYVLPYFAPCAYAKRNIQYNDRVLFACKSYARPICIRSELCGD